MGIEDTLNAAEVNRNIEEMREDIKRIRENELAHIDARLSDVESKVRAPLTTLYLVAAIAVFVGLVAVVTFSGALAASIAGICGVILVLALLAVRKTVRIRRD